MAGLIHGHIVEHIDGRRITDVVEEHKGQIEAANQQLEQTVE